MIYKKKINKQIECNVLYILYLANFDDTDIINLSDSGVISYKLANLTIAIKNELKCLYGAKNLNKRYILIFLLFILKSGKFFIDKMIFHRFKI